VSGRAPYQVEQSRGLGKIDYLSYIAVPLVANFGRQEETELGILHVDTKLFAAPQMPSLAQSEADNPGVYRMTRSRKELDELGVLGSNIYDDEDEDENIKFLEEMRTVIIPVLLLYKKCRTGATKGDGKPELKSN